MKDLPVIKIIRDYPSDDVKLDLEVDDDAHALLVKIGKEEASDADFFEIGFTKLLEEHIKNKDEDE